jgi:septal ring factor EnvC (AmiA/AmiB activator)
MEIEILNRMKSQKEMLPQVVNRIFSICKTDPHFKLKEQIETVEDEINSVKGKVSKQVYLLSQSEKLTKDVERRIAIIREDIESKQTELLEQLGSEL